MYILPVNNNNNNSTSFQALKKVKLVGMADYPPYTHINRILSQFKENKTFQEFCNKFDVNLYISTRRTDKPSCPFECKVKVNYKPPKKIKGFIESLKHFFIPYEKLEHKYAPLVRTNKWEAEKDFATKYEYHNLIDKMKKALEEETSIYSYNNVVKAMTKQ